ncbi:hypothetical protein IH992_18565 [Candidatus Poribacteria bacterium]|nr:hypothetical protein [Candidatus Poribacteria bacterium]
MKFGCHGRYSLMRFESLVEAISPLITIKTVDTEGLLGSEIHLNYLNLSVIFRALRVDRHQPCRPNCQTYKNRLQMHMS